MHSPCIRHCTLNHDDICMGCFRHLNEITGWQKASDKQQKEILKRCVKRKQQYMEQILHYIR
ncbi:DUF1289 domain-containing protein [Celerinatantimonas diazotrophica]|uniref:Uncharacterized protein DUF1289 n=1 Tax=Celerinatantimonas diazotrophica TaxID=412034 RepID=A0A4R1JAL7_9GAMM|nr:DUF1289 domain-containing protein [Celerinatantimonas diazotrophica]TCK47139.1 uncharacterized protein DUF1289 [Celerinatantimonas diazotrophica]CAG9295911.1 hypothetical protein CEDIAZO_01045 [Celerinatantimonas diazotrophica]